MSIIVNLYYTGMEGNARRFAEEMESSGMADAIRSESGNEGYEYFFPMKDEKTVLLIDRWKDQQSIDLHHESSMMKKITELREKYDLHMTVERYIPGTEGVSLTDSKFIRR